MSCEPLFADAHECVFVEEQEPSGRLVLPPCLVCGLAAMDALAQQREALGEAFRWNRRAASGTFAVGGHLRLGSIGRIRPDPGSTGLSDGGTSTSLLGVNLTGCRPDPKPTTEGGIGKPKPRSPKRASRQRWAEIRAAKLGPCYVCRWQGVQQTLDSSLHHIVAKSLGGSDTEANVAPVCGDGTMGHHGLLEAHHPETCRAFAAALQMWDDAAYSYAVEKLGEDRFYARYHVVFEAA